MKLMVRTIFRNVGILLLLPLNIIWSIAIWSTRNLSDIRILGMYLSIGTDARQPLGNIILSFLIFLPIAGFVCLALHTILWLRTRIQVVNE
jgi:hypothetical protein